MIDRHEPTVLPLIDPALCDGCGVCTRLCPTGALGMEGRLAIVASPAKCSYNGICALSCPHQAIQLPYIVVFADGQE